MAQEDEVAPKKKSKVKWIILLVLLLGLGGGGFYAYSSGMLDSFLNPPAEGEEAAAAAKAAAAAGGTAPAVQNIAKLPTFLVNLSDPLGRRYIKLDLELEVVSPSVLAELEAQRPRIRDSLIMLLSSKTFSDLNVPEGKLLLKNEILDRINQTLGGPKVVQVYFESFVIQ